MSRPASPSQLVLTGTSPLVSTLPSTYGMSFRLRNDGHSRQFDRPGQRHARDGELPGNGGPERPLVASPDVALEVHAPHLLLAGWVPQGLERDRELGRPAHVGDARADFPRAVPVQVEAAARAPHLHLRVAEPAPTLPLVGHLSVVLDAGGVGAEHEAVLPVAVRVEDEAERVGLVEGRIAARVGDDDARGFAVVADHADEQGVGRHHEPHLGAFGRRLAFERLLLPEPAHRHGRGPCGVAEDVAVNRRRARGDRRAPRGARHQQGRDASGRGLLGAGRRRSEHCGHDKCAPHGTDWAR